MTLLPPLPAQTAPHCNPPSLPPRFLLYLSTACNGSPQQSASDVLLPVLACITAPAQSNRATAPDTSAGSDTSNASSPSAAGAAADGGEQVKGEATAAAAVDLDSAVESDVGGSDAVESAGRAASGGAEEATASSAGLQQDEGRSEGGGEGGKAREVDADAGGERGEGGEEGAGEGVGRVEGARPQVLWSMFFKQRLVDASALQVGRCCGAVGCTMQLDVPCFELCDAVSCAMR